MKILRADAMGLCFGVRDALRIAESVENPGSVTIHGDLVHNERVLVQLQSRGFSMTNEAQRDAVPPTPAVLITAHGISDRERRRLESAGKTLIDTTCPLVRRVHRSALALEQEGFHVLVIGRRNHVEVRGVVEDLTACDVLETREDVRHYERKKLGIVCQTTVPPSLSQEIRAMVRALNPGAEIRFVDTICQPTRDRQEAVDRLVRRVEAMVVVGGKNSNNTRQLVERCRTAGVPVWHVQSAADVDRQWFAGVETVGLTAGTSTLDETIDEVYDALSRLPAGIPTNSRQWVHHFRRNAESLLEIPWDEPGRLSEVERRAVSRSVQVFQLGESGGGSRLLRAAQMHSTRVGDPQYVESARLFVLEEQRHAALLAQFLEREGIPRIGRQWSNGLFRKTRNLAGLELMLTILLAAEVVATIYYAALRRATGSAVLRVICTQILRDESWHLRFQCQRLSRLALGRRRGLQRLMLLIQTALIRATCLLVWWTHRRAFRAGGMGIRPFWRRARRECRRVGRLIDSAREEI